MVQGLISNERSSLLGKQTNNIQGKWSGSENNNREEVLHRPGYYSTNNSSPSHEGLGTIPEEDVPLISSTRSRSSYLSVFQQTAIIKRFKELSPPRGVITVLLSVLAVIFLVSNVIAVPLYTQSIVTEARSDPYISLILVSFWSPFVYFGQLLIVKVFIDHEVSLVPRTSWKNIFLAGTCVAVQGIKT